MYRNALFPPEQGVRSRSRLRAIVISLLWAALLASMATLTMPASAGAAPKIAALAPGSQIVPYGSTWQYWRATHEPAIAWQYSTDDQRWPSGKAPLGYGASGLATLIPQMTEKPRSSYFRHTFTLDDPALALPDGAQFTTIADDGVLIYVNGHEVGRTRINPIGHPGQSWAYANAPISTSSARLQPVTYKVPSAYLKKGKNVISAQVIANYGSTPDISFEGRLTAGGGGLPAPVGGYDPTMKLVWSDEFNGTTLNRNYWEPYNLSTFGDGGKQTECLMDRPQNLFVKDGNLVLRAQREVTPIKCGNEDTRFPNGRNYTSAHVITRGKIAGTYGRIEMRAKLPVQQGTSQGLWPAFWMRPTDGTLGEIDIMEALGSHENGDWGAGVVHQTVHRDYVGTPSSGYSYLMPNGTSMDDGFHTYAVEWTATEMRWYLDGVLTRTVNPQNLSWYNEAFVGREFFIRLNMAVGGSWPGNADATTQFPAEYQIDYVRWYQ